MTLKSAKNSALFWYPNWYFSRKKILGHYSTVWILKMQMRNKLYIFRHFAKSKKLFFCQYLSFSVWFPLSLKHWSPRNIYPLIWFFRNFEHYWYETLPTENISLCVFFILSASTENMRKVFKRLRRMHRKYLSNYRECSESI